MLTELISRYDTIGHRILDLEAELGVSTEPYKETLDMLIEEAKRAIQVKDAYTREEAVGILRTIDSILLNNGFENRDTNGFVDSYHLFHEGLEAKKLDCDNTSFIYLSIADAIGLPLVAARAPRHIFVRFILNKDEINWETTRAREQGNDYYRSWLNISPAAIDNGVYLRNLTRQETMAGVFINRGIAWSSKGKLEKAIADYNEAIRLDPNYIRAYYNRSIARFRKGNIIGGVVDFIRAKLPILR